MPVIDIDKEQKAQATAKWRAKNREKIREYQKQWREAHPKYDLEYYHRNRETILAQRRARKAAKNAT